LIAWEYGPIAAGAPGTKLVDGRNCDAYGHKRSVVTTDNDGWVEVAMEDEVEKGLQLSDRIGLAPCIRNPRKVGKCSQVAWDWEFLPTRSHIESCFGVNWLTVVRVLVSDIRIPRWIVIPSHTNQTKKDGSY